MLQEFLKKGEKKRFLKHEVEEHFKTKIKKHRMKRILQLATELREEGWLMMQ